MQYTKEERREIENIIRKYRNDNDTMNKKLQKYIPDNKRGYPLFIRWMMDSIAQEKQISC